MNTKENTRPRGLALIPFIVFAVFYVGLSLKAGDFYRVPMTIAFLVASATAIAMDFRRPLADRIETYARGMGETNVMVMCLIFVMSGAFASVAKASGAVDAAVALAQSVTPARAPTIFWPNWSPRRCPIPGLSPTRSPLPPPGWSCGCWPRRPNSVPPLRRFCSGISAL